MSEDVVRAVRGDLTKQQVDAIVNAANEHLHHGGGVAAALVRAGGGVLQDESDRWIREHGPLRPGTAAVTGAGEMDARWVIHVAGPRFRNDQDNAGLLTSAVRAALDAADDIGARSIALPAISAGIFGYPLIEATAVIASACRDWIAEHRESIEEIRLVGYDDATVAAFEAALS